ncbi:MAG: hypothetical protein AAGI34_04880 [Pseudomonadota bacterium]
MLDRIADMIEEAIATLSGLRGGPREDQTPIPVRVDERPRQPERDPRDYR